jgi:hypothetical protein
MLLLFSPFIVHPQTEYVLTVKEYWSDKLIKENRFVIETDTQKTQFFHIKRPSRREVKRISIQRRYLFGIPKNSEDGRRFREALIVAKNMRDTMIRIEEVHRCIYVNPTTDTYVDIDGRSSYATLEKYINGKKN